MAGALGIEPRNVGTKNRCLTAWLRPNPQKWSQKLHNYVRACKAYSLLENQPFKQESLLIYTHGDRLEDLPEFTFDIVPGLLLQRVVEYLRRRPGLDDFTHVKERGFIGEALGLLHRMRNDDDGKFLFQLAD